MKKLKMEVFVISFTVLACGLILSWAGLYNRGQKQTGGVPTLVAKTYIPEGKALQMSFVTVKTIPGEFREPQALSSEKELLDSEGQPKYLSRISILKGEQITKTGLAGLNSKFSSVIPYERVAVTVAMTPDKAVAGLIKPGDTVDIIGTFTFEQSSSEKSKTMTLFRNVKVLAVDKNIVGLKNEIKEISNDFDDYQNMLITVALRPYEAATVIHAQEKGSVRMTLRSVYDGLDLPVPAINHSESIGMPNQHKEIDISKLADFMESTK